VGKAKRRKKGAHVTDPTMAARHDFGGGLLGHDLTSPWIVNVSENTALALDVVQGCVQLIADAVSGSDVGQWNGLQRIDPPSGFTLRPDPDITRRDFLWSFAANLALYQAAWLEEASFDGEILGVRLHCIATVSKIGDDLYVGGKRITNRMRLVRRAVWPTLDIQAGSVLQLAREVFAGAMAANAYQSDFWQQGGAPVMYIKTDQEITSTQAGDIGTAWETQRTTTPGRPPVMGRGADVKTLSVDLAQAGATMSADKLRASMARYFNMPPSYVNVQSEAGPLQYSTDEQLSIRLVKHTLMPYCDVMGEALSAYLPGDYLLGDRIVIDPSRFSRGDQLTRYMAWTQAIQAGWMDAEEVRAEEGLPPGAPEPKPAPVGATNVGA
jgi:hypothetical protein